MRTKEEIFTPPNTTSSELPVKLWMTGVSWCQGDYVIRRRNADFYVIEYIEQGGGRLRVEAEEFHPEAGDVYIVPARSDHEYASSADNPWIKRWFNFSGELIEPMLNSYRLTGIYHVQSCPVGDLFKKGYEAITAEPGRADSKTALILHEIFQAVSEVLEKRLCTDKHSQEGRRLKKYLDVHFSDELSLDALSKIVSRSVSQTIRIFKKDWGVTPYEYLLEKRMEKARLLLRHTVKPVKQIAFELNFSDEYYFSALFKKKNGVSPSQYRISG